MFETVKRGRYISVLSDGKFHESSAKGVDGAVLREYETSDGEKKSKWEIVYDKINARIVNVDFKDGDYGEQMIITIEGSEGEAFLQMGANSQFAESVMKVLRNVELDKEVTFVPYSFVSDKDPDRKIKGMNLYQNGFKVESYFHAQAGDGKWITKNDYPSPSKPREEMGKKEWKRYFEDLNEFLVNFTKANFTAPKPAKKEEVKQDDISPDDIPF